MDFGQLANPQQIDRVQFSLPALDSPLEKAQLERLAKAGARSSALLRIDVGAPIWNHAPWVGSLYPEGTASAEFLKEYAKQFSTVEVNSTFYALPKSELFVKWKESVGADFRFCPKFPKSVSHSMNGEHPDLKLFTERVALLEDKLGVCFLQFPAHVGPDQKMRMQSLFAKIPRSLKGVVEFRHPGFFQDQRLRPEWTEMLARHYLGTAVIDSPGERPLAHVTLSSTRIMIRYLGADLHVSNGIRFQQWAERIALWAKHGIKEVYFIIHEPENTYAAQSASDFIQTINPLLTTPVKAPSFHRFLFSI